MSCQALPLDFGIVAGWEISPVANTGWDGCSIFFHPAYFGAFFSGIDFGTGCASGTLVVIRDIGGSSDIGSCGNHGTTFFFFGEVYSPKKLFISERQIEFDFPPQFHDALCQKASLVPLWQVVLFSEMLQGSRVHNHLLPGISLMSRLAETDMTRGINLLHWRHGGTGGAWKGASLGSSSCICLGS